MERLSFLLCSFALVSIFVLKIEKSNDSNVPLQQLRLTYTATPTFHNHKAKSRSKINYYATRGQTHSSHFLRVSSRLRPALAVTDSESTCALPCPSDLRQSFGLWFRTRPEHELKHLTFKFIHLVRNRVRFCSFSAIFGEGPIRNCFRMVFNAFKCSAVRLVFQAADML